MSKEAPPIVIRSMEAADLQCGFLEALSALKPEVMSDSQARAIFDRRAAAGVRTFVAVVDGRVIGTASLLLEPKFIHSGGSVGHVEDVAVNVNEQHHGVGAALVRHLVDVCREEQCYKVILDCDESVVPFYQKIGFSRWELAMRLDLDD